MRNRTERRDAPARVEVKPAPVAIAGMEAGEIMLVPTPALIEAFMRAIPRGSPVDVRPMRRRLAAAHGAEVTCPIYTGYHLRTVAEAAHEDLRGGVALDAIAPRRVIDARMPTTRRLSFGAGFVAERRGEEGLPA